MHVNTEKGKNKKVVDMIFCSVSVNNSVYVNSHSKKKRSQQVPLVEQGSKHIIEHHDCLYMP